MSEPRRHRNDPDKWFFVVDVKHIGGKRQQIRRKGFPTKKAAEDARVALLASVNDGTWLKPNDGTLTAYMLDEWLPGRPKNLRPSTLHEYDRMIRTYVVPTIGPIPLQDVTGDHLDRLYSELLTTGRPGAEGDPLSRKTVRNLHGLLKKAFSDAIRKKKLRSNPADATDTIELNTPEQKAWTTEELQQFTNSTSTHRWCAAWALMATTGVRRGEVLGLRWADVDMENSKITIRSTRIRFGKQTIASTPKTKTGNRTITIGPLVMASVREWRRTQNAERLVMGAGWQNIEADLVFTNPDGSAPNVEAFSNLFAKLAKRAGLRQIRLHDVRHSYATDALRSGVPVKVVSQRLGHADITVTLRVYAHVMPGDDEQAAEMAEHLVTQKRGRAKM
jgi:integrase